MDSDTVVSPDSVPTSRRAVLRSGAKLAYAAPVVAASMKLAEQASAAQISGGCVTYGLPCVQSEECCGDVPCLAGTCRFV